LIEVELNDLKKAGKDISELLGQRLKREVTVKGDRLIIPETANGQRFGVKDVKTQVKHVIIAYALLHGKKPLRTLHSHGSN
jgi:hypothetical protein